jgi:ubiquitin-conjugating enzyme E2 H
MYPNPSDPLNQGAAILMLKNKPLYESKVREHVLKHAMREVLPPNIMADEELSDIDREDLSALSDTSDIDPELL